MPQRAICNHVHPHQAPTTVSCVVTENEMSPFPVTMDHSPFDGALSRSETITEAVDKPDEFIGTKRPGTLFQYVFRFTQRHATPRTVKRCHATLPAIPYSGPCRDVKVSRDA